LVAGAGVGLVLLGSIWRVGKEPTVDDVLNRGLFVKSVRDVRFGAVLLLVGLCGFGLARIL